MRYSFLLAIALLGIYVGTDLVNKAHGVFQGLHRELVCSSGFLNYRLGSNHRILCEVETDLEDKTFREAFPETLTTFQADFSVTRPGGNDNVAFVVTITSCPEDPENPTASDDPGAFAFYDAAAVLRDSICNCTARNPDSGSNYDSTMYAVIHPDATSCTSSSNGGESYRYDRVAILEELGYWVIIWGPPVNEYEITNPSVRTELEKGKGLRDLMNLYAYKMTNHSVAVMTSFDTVFLGPIDLLVDQLLNNADLETLYATKSDGLVNTGMTLAKTSNSTFDAIVDTIKTKAHNPAFDTGADGLLAYFYSQDTTAHQELSDALGTCVSFEENPTCGKPWECNYEDSWDNETKASCLVLNSAWYAFREQFESRNWKKSDVVDNTKSDYQREWFHGYCINSESTNGYLSSSQECSLQPPEDAVCLQNSNFTYGTFIIDAPGKYKLCEDIIFDPNSPSIMQVSPAEAYEPDYAVYDKNNFGLGFFAAIAVAAPNVEIYLNCHTIQQSEGHALMQRFFAVIELANSPFIPSVGPAQFVGENSPPFQAATNLLIRGPGTIGLSSHHGIHGNENTNITIEDVTFENFEVAATSLNNVDNLVVKNCEVKKNRHDVPIVGLFSAARNILPYGKKLVDLNYSAVFSGESVSALEAYNNLITMVNNVFDDVVNGTGFIDAQEHPEEFHLFDNEFRVIDGPCYAFLVHGRGPAVGGQGFDLSEFDNKTSSNISIENNIVRDIKCWTNEIPATVLGGKVVNDVRGAVFQTVKVTEDAADRPLAITSDGKYKRNPVADMQIMTAKAIEDGILASSPELQTGPNSITSTLIDWAAADPASPESFFSPSYRCNGDSMHHVSKGMIIIRVEDTEGFEISDNVIEGIDNLSKLPFGTTFGTCTDYHAGASVENGNEQQAGNVRAISVAAVKGYNVVPAESSKILNNQISNVTSENSGENKIIVGIDIQGVSEGISIDDNFVNLDNGVGQDIMDEYISFRCREFADHQNNTIVVGNNNVFIQDTKIQTRRLGQFSSRFLESHQHINMDSEWDLGGCPFAHGVAY